MDSKRHQSKAARTRVDKAAEGQLVNIRKRTIIQSFTPEEELNYLVGRGDWELVLTSPAFVKRPPEGKAQLIRESIDNRIDQLAKSVNYLVNRGPEHHAASVGVVQRKQQLERIRDDILRKLYEQYPATIDKKAGVRIDFY